jgi:outer membrane protein OmpA-like peptidoglycan-associated protein
METLADVTADAEGNLAVWVRLPASTSVGDGILQVNGYTAEGYTVTVNSGMTVRAAVPQAVTAPVYFWYQSDQLTSKAKAALAAALSEVPATVPSACTIAPAVRAEGATAALIELAENRAQAVAAYLNRRGISCTVDTEPDTTTSASTKSRRSTVTIRFAN